jgi:hypothetical protein
MNSIAANKRQQKLKNIAQFAFQRISTDYDDHVRRNRAWCPKVIATALEKLARGFTSFFVGDF